MRRIIFCLFFVLGALGLLRAQNYHYVGNYQTPPSSNRYDGFNTQNAPTLWVYNNSASQLVYPASDLQPLVGKLITSVKFKFYNESWYHSEVYSSTMKIHITEVGQEKLKFDTAGVGTYVWYDVDLNSPQIAITDTFTPYSVVGNDRELVFDFSSNPYLYNGGNLLITVTASSDVNADGAVVAYYYYKPSHRKKCAAVWGSDSRQFSNVYTAGGRILNNGVGLGYSTAIDNDLPIVAFGYRENLNTNCTTPSSIRAIDSTHNSVKIAWTAGGSETEWTVQYRKASETAWTTFSPNITAIPEATIAGLEAGTQYAFRVKAVCSPTEESMFGSLFMQKTLCTSVSTVSENFEGTPVESIPNCWTRIIGGSITKFPSVVASKTTFGVPSKAMAFAHRQPQFVVLPAMSVPLNTLQLKFKLNREDDKKCKEFKVGYMSDPNDTSTFVAVASFDDHTYKTMLSKQVFFTGVADNGGVNRYIAFRSGYKPKTVESYDYYYWVDDVEVSPAPTCMPATNLKVSNIKHDAADISFKHEASANTWQYVYTDDPSANPDALTPTTITSDSITVSRLTADTEYRLWVRTKCSPTDSSEWSIEPITFRTVCQDITSLPWTADFASPMATNGNLPSCWTKVISFKGGWPQKIYPEVVDGKLAFRANNSYFDKKQNLVVTPKFGVALDTLEVSFTLTRTNKKSAPFIVGVMSDPSDTATFVAMDNIASTDSLTHTYDVSLAAAPSTHRYIAFRLIPDPTGSSGYEMDDLDIHRLPACRRPIRLSVEEATISTDSAVVSWNAGGTETRWTLEYKTKAATVWTKVDSISTNSYTLNNLIPSTRYLVRVKSLCTATASESAFTNELSFFTQCGITTLPFSEDFTKTPAATFPPRCWARYDQKVSDVFGGAVLKDVKTSSYFSGIWKYDESAYGMNTGGKAKINIYGSSTYGWLVTPSIRLEANSTLEFDLSFTQKNSSAAVGNIKNDDKFMVIVSTDDGATWTKANSVVWGSDSTDTYSLNVVNNIPTPFSIDLSQYSGVVKIAFYAESTVSNADNDLYLDNIVLKKIVYDPPTVVTLPADNIGDNTATLHMTAKEGSHIIDAQGFFYKADTASATWKRTLDSVVTGLSPRTTYLFYAYAEANGTVYNGATLSFTTTGAPVVHPTVTTEAATDITLTGATLHKTVTADPSEPVTEQGWKWRKATDATWLVSPTGRLTSLEPNTKYEFYAYATTGLNAAGYNGDILSFTTLAHTPPKVTTLDATAIGMYAATLRKTVVAGTEPIVEQGWYYKKVGEVVWTKTTDGNLNGLGQNTEYEFYAYAVTSTFPTTNGDTLRFTTFAAVDVESVDYKVIVYPNPADDFVTIALDGSTDGADVQIADMLGRVVGRYRIAAGESGITLDVSSFAAGNYLVRIVSGDRVVIEKLIIEQK